MRPPKKTTKGEIRDATLFGLMALVAGMVYFGYDADARQRPRRDRILEVMGIGADGSDASAIDYGPDGGDAAADGGDAAADGGDAAADGGDAAADGGDAAADGGDAFVNDLSIDLDGIDESMIIADNAAMEPGAAWSFCGWYKEDTAGFPDEFVDKFVAAQTAVRIRKTTTLKIRWDLNASANNAQSTSNLALSNGVWYFHCFVYNGSGVTDSDKCKHYLNAVDQPLTFSGTIPTSINDTTSQWQVGGGVTGFWGPGNIDEVTFWNVALSSGQVTTLYNSGHPGKPSTTNLVSYYHCGDWDTFPTASDNAGTAQNGTYTNMESGDLLNDVP